MSNRYEVGECAEAPNDILIADNVTHRMVARTPRRELESVRDLVRRANSAGELLELLTLALPCVEESEQFNKPSCRDLSKKIRAAISKAEGKT